MSETKVAIKLKKGVFMSRGWNGICDYCHKSHYRDVPLHYEEFTEDNTITKRFICG